MKKVAIIGATSLTGEKLIEVLSNHPKAEVALATSNTYAGKPVAGLDLKYEPLDIDKVKKCDIVFSCLPHSKSMSILPSLVSEVELVVDLGADFRTPADSFKKWYGFEHEAKELTPATYGLSEVFAEEIKKANFIANPGCYPTSFLLAIVPLLEGKVDLEDVTVFSLSGRSGAGRKKANEFAEEKENAFSYEDPYNHQHIGEMEYIASKLKGEQFELFAFSPHVLSDVFQGMHTTIVAKCEMDSYEQLVDIYKNYYKGQPFIKIEQVQGNKLDMASVVNTNNCIIGLDYDKNPKRLYIISIIDNLVKGASGQAIQNMNLAMGWDQKLGLIG